MCEQETTSETSGRAARRVACRRSFEHAHSWRSSERAAVIFHITLANRALLILRSVVHGRQMYTCPTPNPGSRLRLRPTRGCGCLAAAAAAAPAPSAAAPPAAVLAAGCCCCCRCCCWLRLRLSSSIKRLRTHTKRELQMARERVIPGQFKRGNVQQCVCSMCASCRCCRCKP